MNRSVLSHFQVKVLKRQCVFLYPVFPALGIVEEYVEMVCLSVLVPE